MYNRTPKGSQWRKWDCHIHTPASILNHHFGNNWDNYVSQLFKKAIEHNIASIGITDYFSIEGYTILKRDYLENEAKLKDLFDDIEIEQIRNILIFPNIEFRIDKLVANNGFNDKWNRKVNFHLLLSDDIALDDIQNNLIQNIKFETLEQPGRGSQQRNLSVANLSALGAQLKAQHEPFQQYSDLFVGMMNASVNISQIQEELIKHAAIFDGKYLLALPGDEDLSTVSWNDGGHTARKILLQKADIIMSSNPNTVKFGLGKFHESEDVFCSEFLGLKPCIWGSDAHDFDDLFKPNEDRYTWIKADPTFEGLKGVIFEPESRVKIQQEPPQSKPPYLVIDKVRFTDNSGKEIFGPEFIEFNPNLNAIIGGKSSGKSLLHYHIAKAIDPNQVIEKGLNAVSDYGSFYEDHPFDIEVYWQDGSINTLNQSEDKDGQITYIPQLYINHLAEKSGKEELFKLIESILDQNDNYRDYKQQFDRKVYLAKEAVQRSISELLFISESVREKKNEIQALGTEQQLTAEITRIKNLVETLAKQSGMTDAETKQYSDLEEEKRKRISELKATNLEERALTQVLSSIGKEIDNVNEKILKDNSINVQNISLTNIENIDQYTSSLIGDINKSFQLFKDKVESLLRVSQDQGNDLTKRLSEIETQLGPFITKAKNQEVLKAEQRNLMETESKLMLLKTKKEELEKLNEQGKQKRDSLFTAYDSLFTQYKDLVSTLSQPEFRNIGDDLHLIATLKYNTDQFSTSFASMYDRRGNFNNIFDQRFDEQNNFIFNNEQHLGDIKMIYTKIRSGESQTNLRLRANSKPEEVYHRLFDDYFQIEFSVLHHDEDILTMSPGKRGLVLLQLILHISTATHPILIDQPEDNLDNRTIYNELKQFITKKKNDRQIIIVTHNANLVVSTDAECVIVANQGGQNSGKENRKYQFEYISGSLEHTFSRSSFVKGILYQQGIREHVCDILEGGRDAFMKREKKYGFSYMK